MSTPNTLARYEEELQDITSNPRYADIRGRLLDEVYAKRKGYHQAVANMKPRHEALVKAAKAVLPHLQAVAATREREQLIEAIRQAEKEA